MESHQDLLNLARPFCVASTGEVVQRLPDELMQQLRAAKLARGIPGSRSDRTQTFATWFVFFTDQIRDEVLLGIREARHKQKRGRKGGAKSNELPPAASDQSTGDSPGQRGLAKFRRLRNSSK